MSQKIENKLYLLLVPDKVKYKAWLYDFSNNTFELKKLVDVDFVVPNKSVDVLIPHIQESKLLVQALLSDIDSPTIRLFDVKSVSKQLNTRSVTAKKLIQELAKTPELMLQSVLTNSDVCNIEHLLNLYWNDFCKDTEEKAAVVRR
jgi:hypothetical protein